MDTARSLDLFAGRKIWLMLDGVIGQDITSQSMWTHMKIDLPIGMLALAKRPPMVTDARTLFAIIKVIGDAAANTHSNARGWPDNGLEPRDADVSCWKNATSARIKYSQILWR